MSAAARLRQDVKNGLIATVPLPLRMRVARLVGRSRWPGGEWWAAELVRDLARRDPNAYHRFLWSNHLAYARTYEPEQRFGAERLHPSRRLLFDELRATLQALGAGAVSSVLEVGCSMGYLLRHLETEVFPAASVLDGIDIDGYAIERGAEVLRRDGSRVRLAVGDACGVERAFGAAPYDLVVCAGVLMYLRQEDAARAVAAMLGRTAGLLALAGLAHPVRDNAGLGESVPRERDRAWIHDLDAMVAGAGGRVVARRWDGARQVGGNTIYFVFAEPAGGARWTR